MMALPNLPPSATLHHVLLLPGRRPPSRIDDLRHCFVRQRIVNRFARRPPQVTTDFWPPASVYANCASSHNAMNSTCYGNQHAPMADGDNLFQAVGGKQRSIVAATGIYRQMMEPGTLIVLFTLPFLPCRPCRERPAGRLLLRFPTAGWIQVWQRCCANATRTRIFRRRSLFDKTRHDQRADKSILIKSKFNHARHMLAR